MRMAFSVPRLLLLGGLRMVLMLLLTVAAAVLTLAYHQDILAMMWTRPDSAWLVWFWHVISWLIALLLIGLSALLAYILSQLLFSVVIMDLMSRITERMLLGQAPALTPHSYLQTMVYLIKQELPRALLPLLLTLFIMLAGWLTPLGPVITILSSLTAVTLLAWDNTDLVPARRQYPFKQRWYMFRRGLWFHLGFGLLFLIPILNVVALSFAPVGATLYYLETHNNPEDGQ